MTTKTFCDVCDAELLGRPHSFSIGYGVERIFLDLCEKDAAELNQKLQDFSGKGFDLRITSEKRKGK